MARCKSPNSSLLVKLSLLLVVDRSCRYGAVRSRRVYQCCTQGVSYIVVNVGGLSRKGGGVGQNLLETWKYGASCAIRWTFRLMASHFVMGKKLNSTFHDRNVSFFSNEISIKICYPKGIKLAKWKFVLKYIIVRITI